MNSKLLVFSLFGCVLTISIYYSQNVSNHPFSKQPKAKVKVSKFEDYPKSNSNRKNISKEPCLKRWMNEKEKKYKKDRERIKEICQKYNVTSRTQIDRDFLFVDRNHKMALCLNAKVGSTTWVTHLKDLIPTKTCHNNESTTL